VRGASRDALAAAQERLDGQLADTPDAAMPIAEGLLQVTRLLAGERCLARTLADSVVDAQARDGLLDAVFGGKVRGDVLEVLRVAVAQRWSDPADLLDGIEELGTSAALAAADAAGGLDDVEDELFRFARIVDGSRALRAALADTATPASVKTDLLHSLLAAKTSAVTQLLVETVVAAPRGRQVDRALDDLASAAAARRHREIAVVTSAVPLTADQSERLAAAVGHALGRAVRLQQRLDPTILGGAVVRVGDQVLDGSVLQRMSSARRLLTR
jgi:F-type H+-transporting ATPase subunit delta